MANPFLNTRLAGKPQAVIAAIAVLSLAAVLITAFTRDTGVASMLSGDADAPRHGVSALGRLEPASEVVDISGINGTRLVSLAVGEGATVKAGDVLAYTEGYEQRRAAVKRAEAALKEGRELYRSQKMNGDATVEEAQLRLQQLEEQTPLEIKMQQAVLNRINGDLVNARRTLDRLQKLQEQNTATDQDVDNQKTAVLRLEEDLAREQFNLTRLRASRKVDHLMAAQKVSAAQGALDSALVTTRLKSLEADLQVAGADLEQTIIRAPTDGTILKILTRPGERIGGKPILKMGDISHMYAVAEVYETDINLVKPGLRATITSPALEQAQTGVVERISPLIFKNDVIDIDPASRVDARIVEVRIRLDHSNRVAHLSNLQVQVNIHLDGEGGSTASR